MGRLIGYGKLGRSMPLALERCGNLGGDVEMVAVVKTLALRHPEDTFVLVGRNDGSNPAEVGLPSNVINPWRDWGPQLRDFLRVTRTAGAALDVDAQLKIVAFLDDLTGPYFELLDAMVMWVGQHGTTNAPLPSVMRPGELTKPYDWSVYYASFMLRGINKWRDRDPFGHEEVNLNADPRNRHKMRDLKWPLRHPVLTQYTFENNLRHERYGETGPPHATVWGDAAPREDSPGLWSSRVHNVYARLEVNGLVPGTPFGDLISYNDDWTGREHFGLFINEARAVGIRPETARLQVVRDWVLPLEPHFMHGTWSAASQARLGRRVEPAPWSEYYPRLHSVRCTLTTPSSGSGWATAKPWEAFAAGTVCFFHPLYDTQNNILGDASEHLRRWLRVSTAADLETRVRHLSSRAGHADWAWLVGEQRRHFERALARLDYLHRVEERIWR